MGISRRDALLAGSAGLAAGGLVTGSASAQPVPPRAHSRRAGPDATTDPWSRRMVRRCLTGLSTG